MEGCRFVLRGIIASTRSDGPKVEYSGRHRVLTDSVLRPPAERPDSTARWPVARARLASLPVAILSPPGPDRGAGRVQDVSHAILPGSGSQSERRPPGVLTLKPSTASTTARLIRRAVLRLSGGFRLRPLVRQGRQSRVSWHSGLRLRHYAIRCAAVQPVRTPIELRSTTISRPDCPCAPWPAAMA